jgi:hypothetical protein
MLLEYRAGLTHPPGVLQMIARPFAVLAAIVSPAVAAAQVCTGGIAPEANTRINFAGATLDMVANANAYGGRVGVVANRNGRDIPIYLGIRSIDGGTKSILAADFGYSVDVVKNPAARVCALINVDMVNLSDGDNGYANVMFGIGIGSARKTAGGTAFMPFGIVAGNLNSTGESEMGEFSGMLEGGVGFRLGNGITLTPSFRQSLQTGAEPVIRFLAMFPLSTKPMK